MRQALHKPAHRPERENFQTSSFAVSSLVKRPKQNVCLIFAAHLQQRKRNLQHHPESSFPLAASLGAGLHSRPLQRRHRARTSLADDGRPPSPWPNYPYLGFLLGPCCCCAWWGPSSPGSADYLFLTCDKLAANKYQFTFLASPLGRTGSSSSELLPLLLSLSPSAPAA